MTTNPHATCANKINHLATSLERTRDEVKDAIGALMSDDVIRGSEIGKAVCARLHRTVSSITEDLES